MNDEDTIEGADVFIKTVAKAFAILILFMALIMSVEGSINDFNSLYPMITVASRVDHWGIYFMFNKSTAYTLHNATLFNSNPTWVEIIMYNTTSSSWQSIQRTNLITSGVATFTNVNLIPYQNYSIFADKAGSAFEGGYNTSSKTVRTLPDTVFLGGCYRVTHTDYTFTCGLGSYTGNIMTVFLTETPSQSPSGMTIQNNYTINIQEDTISNHKLRLNWTNFNITSSTASLIHNGTRVAGTIITSQFQLNGSVIFEANMTIPIIYNNPTAMPFYWSYNITNGTNIQSYNTSIVNQNVSYRYNHYNISVRDWFANTPINEFNISFDGGSFIPVTTSYNRITPNTEENVTVVADRYATVITLHDTTSGNLLVDMTKTIPYYFKVNAFNYLNTSLLALTDITVSYVNETQRANPYTRDVADFINESVESRVVNVYIEDLSYAHQDLNTSVNISGSQYQFNVSLEPNKLVLNFYQDGSAYNTMGYISDTNRQIGFNDTSIVVIQQNLSIGDIHVRFGSNVSGVGWTQYYEYENDHKTHVNEDLEVLQQADWSAYIQVLDYTNSPLNDVIVRAEYSFNELNNWTYHKLLGQRLTDDEGYTFFIADSRTEVLFTFTKEGYQPIEALITIGDESFTKSNPLMFFMQEADDTTTDKNAFMYIQKTLNNQSLSLEGYIVAKGKERVQVTTSYREYYELDPRDITEDGDEFDRYSFTLIDGTDYDISQETDVVVYVYLDNVLWKTVTISWNNPDKTHIFNFSDIDDFLVVLMLIVIPAGAGFTFKSSEAGISTFMGVCIASGFISSSFLWVSFVGILYFIAKGLYHVVSH